jgi:hypothetical protein
LANPLVTPAFVPPADAKYESVACGRLGYDGTQYWAEILAGGVPFAFKVGSAGEGRTLIENECKKGVPTLKEESSQVVPTETYTAIYPYKCGIVGMTQSGFYYVEYIDENGKQQKIRLVESSNIVTGQNYLNGLCPGEGGAGDTTMKIIRDPTLIPPLVVGEINKEIAGAKKDIQGAIGKITEGSNDAFVDPFTNALNDSISKYAVPVIIGLFITIMIAIIIGILLTRGRA